MKEKFRQVLRVFRVDVLLFTLYAKIALAVTKKLTALKNAVQSFLTRLFPRNGKRFCATRTAVDPAATVTANAVVDRTTNTAVAAVTNSPVTATATATATATVTIATP